MSKRLPLIAVMIFGIAASTILSRHEIVNAASTGKAIYESKCASCHQVTGQGLAGAFPPLAGNNDVTGDPNKAISAIVKGLNGPLTVNGKTYNGVMPPWKGQLSNTEIAAVLTYVRTSWGNKASAITEQQVAAFK